MIEWVKRLRAAWVGPFCQHNWKIIKEIDVMDDFVSEDIPSDKIYVMQCEKCGDLKKVRLKG